MTQQADNRRQADEAPQGGGAQPQNAHSKAGAAARTPRAPAILAMGFRPFFLVAALYAVVATLYWLHALMSGVNLAIGGLSSTLWHAHEMLFGFGLGVVAGFLLTAARAWTKLETARGGVLLGLVALWASGRVAMLAAVGLPPVVVLLIVCAFPIALAAAVGRVILIAKSERNYGILGILVALALLNLGVQLEQMGVVAGWARPLMYATVHVVVLLNVIIGGRIVPMFTRNRLKRPAVKNIRGLDLAAIATASAIPVFAVIDAMGGVGSDSLRTVFGIVALVAGLAQLARMIPWGTRHALAVPMLAILHSGYAWIGLGYLLLAATLLTRSLPMSTALHALTIGVIGVMTVGMMTRVSLGHTGRKIAASTTTVLAYAAINLAVFARLMGVVVPPTQLRHTWTAAGVLFALAYLLFVVEYSRYLLRPRPDGKPG